MVIGEKKLSLHLIFLLLLLPCITAESFAGYARSRYYEYFRINV
jgi:hypothetical protein